MENTIVSKEENNRKTENKVSIIVPVYNVEKYLYNCLNSIVNQTYKNLEIVVVNDGTKDNSEAIILQFAEKDERVKYIKKENGGLSSARNLGIENSTGKYVVFVDSDDYININTIKILVEQLETNKLDMVCCDFVKVNETKICKFPKINFNNAEKISNTEFLKRAFIANTLQGIVAWGKLYKKEIIDNIRFDEKTLYGEDFCFNYYYLKKCKSVGWLNQKLCAYVQRKNSLVKSNFSTKKLTALTAQKGAIVDMQTSLPEVEQYARLFHFYQNLETLFFIYRSDFKDKEIIETLLKDMQDNYQYFKQCKGIVLWRKMLVPLGYRLLNLVTKRKLKKLN